MPYKKEEKKIKKYPSSPEAEKSLLACLLLDRNVAMNLLGKLTEADFFEQNHKFIFRAMRALDAEGAPIDVVSVSEKLPRVGASPEQVGMDYLTTLLDFIPSTAGYNSYFTIIKKNSLLRGLLSVSEKISENVYLSDNADDSMEYAEQLILDLAKNNSGTSLVSVSEIVPKVIDEIQEEATNGKQRGLMTGFKNLDYHLNGLKKSDVILLAARPGIGKTAFALNIAANIASNPEYTGKNVLVFSLEMSANQLVTRMLCNLGKMDNQKINKGELGFDEYVKLRSAAQILCESGIYIDQTANSNPMQLFSKCKQFKIEHGSLDLIIIDYLQLMDLPADKGSDSRQQEVAFMSRRIKLLAKELEVPVILLSQLSRAAEIRQEKPQLHDLRDSGSIEQDADIVMFLYKEKNQDPQNEIIELIIAKYRNGRQGSLAFKWQGQFFEFIPQKEDVLDKIVVYGKDGQVTLNRAGGAVKDGANNANAANKPSNSVSNNSPASSPSALDISSSPIDDQAPPPTQADAPPFSVDVGTDYSDKGVEASGLTLFEDSKPSGDK